MENAKLMDAVLHVHALVTLIKSLFGQPLWLPFYLVFYVH